MFVILSPSRIKQNLFWVGPFTNTHDAAITLISTYLQCKVQGLTTCLTAPKDREECRHTANGGGRSSTETNTSKTIKVMLLPQRE